MPWRGVWDPINYSYAPDIEIELMSGVAGIDLKDKPEIFSIIGHSLYKMYIINIIRGGQ